ncbi:MAG: UvrD-helicase domain-containing protein, partial [Clostridia bacterium]|nr:UvrD-helicase domain-containing protein [Clostridia bacterium]
MAQVKWTDDQLKAIEGRKGTLLVSAAAGSGKTAVLVERVIRRICDKENPCDVENLLIVTFTNAAAAQMKEKISAAIGKKIAENPDDKRLRRQQLMLPCANICTIDSFCINLVRENFHALGISPDFGLIDEGKLGILREKAVTAVVESLHESATPEFRNLCELISDTKDDKKLIDAILRLYSLSRAYPFPELWLRSLPEEFASPKAAEESPWGRILLSQLTDMLDNCIGGINYCLGLLKNEPELENSYAPLFADEKAAFIDFRAAVSDCDWDGVCEAYVKITFGRMPSAPRGYDSAAKNICKSIRDEYKKQFKDAARMLAVSAQEHKADVTRLAPVVEELINAVIAFSAEFKRLKDEENGADFSDTLHMALELLVELDSSEQGYK